MIIQDMVVNGETKMTENRYMEILISHKYKTYSRCIKTVSWQYDTFLSTYYVIIQT